LDVVEMNGSEKGNGLGKARNVRRAAMLLILVGIVGVVAVAPFAWRVVMTGGTTQGGEPATMGTVAFMFALSLLGTALFADSKSQIRMLTEIASWVPEEKPDHTRKPRITIFL
jgi:hypothetical protein